MKSSTWPRLPLGAWLDTYATLHMWTQVVGKICLARTARINHFWNIAFQVTSRGLMTPLLTEGDRTFTMSFDFIAHEFRIESSDGRVERIPLEPRTVADFYRVIMEATARLGLDVHIWTMPVEVPNPIRFETDVTHRSYDPDSANACWRILNATRPIFERFRSGFIGKCSPVHFFWGSFDLAVTRFSGRPAPERPNADSITRESYSHEVISHGFWPGRDAQEAAFYAYAAPEPAGFKDASIRPPAAFYNTELSEVLLPYEAVRSSPSPDAMLTEFLQSTYDAGATLARWDRAALERPSTMSRPS